MVDVTTITPTINPQALDGRQSIIIPVTGQASTYFLEYLRKRNGYLTSLESDLVTTAEELKALADELAARQIIATDGLVGGGTLDADITIGMDPAVGPTGSYTNSNITVDQFGRVTAAANGSGGGGGGGSWTVAASWTYSSPVSSVPFTGLSGTDFLVIARNLTFASNSAGAVRVSVDNGASYLSTSGDYLAVATTGVASASTHFGNFVTSFHTAARDGLLEILGNTGASPPIGRPSANQESFRMFVGSTSPINAIQVFSGNTGSPNFTGGSIFVLSR